MVSGLPLGIPLFGSGGKKIVSLYFSGDAVKLSCLRNLPGKKELVGVKYIEIKDKANEQIASAIRAFLTEIRFEPSAVNIILPSHLVITKSIEIPSVDPEEIRRIVDLQAGRHTPYSREEVIIDHVRIGSYRRNYTKVLLTIVTQATIKRQIDILAKARLKTDRILFSAETVAAGYSKIMKLDADDRIIGILHIDRTYTDFINVLRGKLVFVRNIPIGAEHFAAERERHQIRFVEEMRKSLEVYRSEEIERAPSELILTGAIDEKDSLKQSLSDSLHIPAKIFPYPKYLRATREVIRSIGVTKSISFFDTIASLMVADRPLVNLITEEIRLRKQFEEKSRDLIKAGAFVITAIALVCGLIIGRIYLKESYIALLNERHGTAVGEAQEALKLTTKIVTVKRYLRGRGTPLELLDELYSLVPADIYLTKIQLDARGRFQIEGKARAMAVVFVLSGDMEDSEYFKNVELRRTTKRKDREGETVVDFEISCFVVTGEEAPKENG